MLSSLLTTIKEASGTDELFPGLDPSAFDEHLKFKQTRDTVDAIQKRILRLEHQEIYARNQSRSIIKYFKTGSAWQASKKPTEEAMSQQPWIDKYPRAKTELENVLIDTAAPVYKHLERYVAQFDLLSRQEDRAKREITKLKSKLLRVRKQESESILKNAAKNIPQQNIDPNTVSKTILVDYRTSASPSKRTDKIENPYVSPGNTSAKFAGHPAHYNWTGKERTMYYELTKFVKRLGLPPLDLMYAYTPRYTDFKYYLTNKDNSVTITNCVGYGIYVYAKGPHVPNDLPLRFRMRKLERKNMDWLFGKIDDVKV